MFKKKEEMDVMVGVARQVVESGLFPKDNSSFEHFSEILIDLDSILSVMLHLDLDVKDYVKAEYAEIIVSTLGSFIGEYQSTSFIKIYYNMDEYKTFSTINSNWCEKRQLRYGESEMVTFIHKNLIRRLKVLEKNINNFKLVKCEDSPILKINEDIKLIKKPYLIISRDPHYTCLFLYNDNIHIYDGKHILNKENIRNIRSYPDIDYSLLPYYYLLCGMSRNEYSGMRGLGPKKTIKYLNENLSDILSETDDKLLSVIQYKDIFFLK